MLPSTVKHEASRIPAPQDRDSTSPVLCTESRDNQASADQHAAPLKELLLERVMSGAAAWSGHAATRTGGRPACQVTFAICEWPVYETWTLREGLTRGAPSVVPTDAVLMTRRHGSEIIDVR